MGMDLSRPGRFYRLKGNVGTVKGAESGVADLRQTQRPPRQKGCTDKEALYSGVNGVMCYGMDRDLLLVAKDDELARKLQDLGLPVRKRAPKRRW